MITLETNVYICTNCEKEINENFDGFKAFKMISDEGVIRKFCFKCMCNNLFGNIAEKINII